MTELITRSPIILGIMIALALAEWYWRTRFARRGYDIGASLGSIGVAGIGAIIKPITAGIIAAAFTAAHAIAPITLALDDWRIWAVAFFAVEFVYYWFHRFSHTINWLWASHAVHHSANEITLPAAIRLGWTGALSGGWLLFVPLILIGFPPLMIGGLLAANLLYQYTLHTEAVGRLWRPIEYVFNTPSHHRAHHASDAAWLDCNFGGVLIIFDRVFGTWKPEPVEGGLRYGLVTPLRSHNPMRIALHQWGVMLAAFARAPSWTRRWTVLFGRPSALDSAIGSRHPAEGQRVVHSR